MLEGQFNELSDAVTLASGNYKILWSLLLQHQPHRLNVVSRMAPVSFRIKIA